MIRSTQLWDTALSRVEQSLGRWLSPESIAVVVAAVSVMLLVVSVFLPADVLTRWPNVTSLGQNTLLAVLLFAIALRLTIPAQARPGYLVWALYFFPLLLSVVVIVQSLMLWLPEDGWYRIFLNTANHPSAWPGRMTPIGAQLLFMTFLAGLLLRFPHKAAVLVAGLVIGVVALISAARASSHLLGLSMLPPDNRLTGTLTPFLAYLLVCIHFALAGLLLRHPVYQAWESGSPGQSAFLKVAALLSLVLVAVATAALGYARQGLFGAAALTLLLLSCAALLVVYIVIVSVVDERRCTELALRDRETALEKAQQVGRIGSWRLSYPRGALEWSRECYRIFGVLQGTPMTLELFMSMVHPDDLELVQHHWTKGIESEIYDIEHRIVVGKNTRWVRERAEFLWNDSRTKCECLGTVQDITDSKLKEIELLRSRERIRRLAAHNEKIREQERAKIARELHDEMGQHLTALRLQTAMVQMRQTDNNPEMQAQLQDIKDRIDLTIDVVRSVAASQRPSTLDAGLEAACRWLLESYVEKAGIKTEFESAIDESSISDAVSTTVFRILQESLTNVIRHSGATRVLVWMTQEMNELTITVTDNGRGFDPEKLNTGLHFGLIGIRERALNFQGEASIASAPGKGCSITVSLPTGMNNKN